MSVAGLDLGEIVRRALKYLVEGVAVSVAAYMIPQKKLKIEEVLMIALTAAATFAILDIHPSYWRSYPPRCWLRCRRQPRSGLNAPLPM